MFVHRQVVADTSCIRFRLGIRAYSLHICTGEPVKVYLHVRKKLFKCTDERRNDPIFGSSIGRPVDCSVATIKSIGRRFKSGTKELAFLSRFIYPFIFSFLFDYVGILSFRGGKKKTTPRYCYFFPVVELFKRPARNVSGVIKLIITKS